MRELWSQEKESPVEEPVGAMLACVFRCKPATLRRGIATRDNRWQPVSSDNPRGKGGTGGSSMGTNGPRTGFREAKKGSSEQFVGGFAPHG